MSESMPEGQPITKAEHNDSAVARINRAIADPESAFMQTLGRSFDEMLNDIDRKAAMSAMRVPTPRYTDPASRRRALIRRNQMRHTTDGSAQET